MIAIRLIAVNYNPATLTFLLSLDSHGLNKSYPVITKLNIFYMCLTFL